MGRLQCPVDTNRKEPGHQQVILLAPLRLNNSISMARFVIE